MKNQAFLFAVSLLVALPRLSHAQALPVWELGSSSLTREMVTGKVEFHDGVLRLDGTNAIALPATILGGQEDYTIEFELKLADNFEVLPRMQGALDIVSNMDDAAKAGLALRYLPPEWDSNGGQSNTFWLSTNGHRNGSFQGMRGNGFNRYSLVVKDRSLTIFRDGLLLAAAAEIRPSQKPLTVGEVLAAGAPGNAGVLPAPYELRNLKVHRSAIFPTGFDDNADIMEQTSGEGYMLLRARIPAGGPNLPRILVVGDSQSMGYRKFITEIFKERAFVDHWIGGGWLDPADPTKMDSKTKQAWKGVLGNGPYDVITWNSMTGHMWSIKHPERCPVESILPNYSEMVRYIQSITPRTRIIWVKGTPRRDILEDGVHIIDDESPANMVVLRNNELVSEVMRKYKIPEVDLYVLSKESIGQVERGGVDNVHWSPEVYRKFARVIADEISRQLDADK